MLRFCDRSRSLAGQQLGAQRGGNLARDVILEDEDAADFAVERLRPKVVTVGHGKQRSGDADPASLPLDASFEDLAHFELLADVEQILGLSQAERRGASRYAQALDLRQRADDLAGHAVREISLVALRAEVGEGKDGDGWFGSGDRHGPAAGEVPG